jgi:DHA1 family bicyclomycin/chloramphenicol resistance-like MFS transporter
MVATIAACAVAAFILTRLTLGPRKPVTQLAE